MVFLMLLVPSEVVVTSILLLVALPSPWLSHHGLSSVAVVALDSAALVAAPAVMAHSYVLIMAQGKAAVLLMALLLLAVTGWLVGRRLATGLVGG